MARLTWRGVFMACLVLCAFLGFSARALGDAEEWNALLGRWNEAFDAGRYQEAERIGRRMQAIDENPTWKCLLGMALSHQGKYQEAEPLLEAFLRFSRREHGDHVVTIESLGNLGGLYSSQGRFEEAQKLLEEGVQMSQRLRGANDVTTIAGLTCQTNLASVVGQRGDLARAAKLFREIIDQLDRRPIGTPLQRLSPVVNLGILYRELGRHEQAEAITRYGLALARHLGIEAHHPTVIYLARNMAENYVSRPGFRRRGRYWSGR